MNLNYRCKHISLADGIWVKEPIIPITLIGNNQIKLNFTAILDSGSDFVLLPLEVAEALKLKFNKLKKDSAKMYTGDSITTTQSTVRIKIEKNREKTIVDCKCAILLNEKKQHEHIIFGSSFFEHFKILFDYPKNKFQIKN